MVGEVREDGCHPASHVDVADGRGEADVSDEDEGEVDEDMDEDALDGGHGSSCGFGARARAVGAAATTTAAGDDGGAGTGGGEEVMLGRSLYQFSIEAYLPHPRRHIKSAPPPPAAAAAAEAAAPSLSDCVKYGFGTIAGGSGNGGGSGSGSFGRDRPSQGGMYIYINSRCACH
jgi:hypothetical protein